MGVAGRWRPVLRAVSGALRRHAAHLDNERLKSEQLENRLLTMQQQVNVWEGAVCQGPVYRDTKMVWVW